MKRRYFTLVLGLVWLAAAFTSTAQTPSPAAGATHEKLYISLESTDTVAVVDLK